MGCEPIIRNGVLHAWACSIGRKEKPKCYKCGKPAKILCDYRGSYKYHKGYRDERGKVHLAYETTSLDTCDKPMCADCANEAGDDLHYCDNHNNEFSMRLSALSDGAYAKMLKKVGVD